MRLIDADKLIEICNKGWRLGSAINTKIYHTVDASDIRNQPTVDAEPVRHGRWIEVDVGDCCYRCSECGFIRDAYLLDISNYCPKCGAKMDGGRE